MLSKIRNCCLTQANISCGCLSFAVPTVTKVTPAVENGVVLNVEEAEEITKENGAEPQIKTGDEAVAQSHEPSTSSGSDLLEVIPVVFLLHVTFESCCFCFKFH